MLSAFGFVKDARLLTKAAGNEDAHVVHFPDGKALVQTVDIITPIVNNPYWFGQIAASNALSDIYAMGGLPYCAMNIVCFPIDALGKEVLKGILEGGRDKVQEAGAVLTGGHSIKDREPKYGLAVSGIVDPDQITANGGLRPGDQLLLTKPIGTGVLATALKGGFDEGGRIEGLLFKWCARLNAGGQKVIVRLGLQAATDITGFGLVGHLLEMARASGVTVDVWAGEVPLYDQAEDLLRMGLFPGGSGSNKQFCSRLVEVSPGLDQIRGDLLFDAQTSGGLLLAVPQQRLREARDMLEDEGDLAAHIGEVGSTQRGRPCVRIL